MELSHWLTLSGWIVSALIGIGASLVLYRIQRTRRTLAWSVKDFTPIFSRARLDELSSVLDQNISLSLHDRQEDISDVTLLSIRLANVGNETIEGFAARVTLGGATILRSWAEAPSRTYAESIAITDEASHGLRVTVPYLNRADWFDLHIATDAVSSQVVAVDVAEKGLRVTRTSYRELGVEISRALRVSFFRGARLFLPWPFAELGARSDPHGHDDPTRIAEELRAIREILAWHQDRTRFINPSFDKPATTQDMRALIESIRSLRDATLKR